MKTLLLLALLPVAAVAQLQVVLYRGIEQPLTSVTELGSAAIGDIVEFRFRVKNSGAAAAALQTITVQGQGFALTDRPTLPYVIAPGSNVEFRVTFTAASVGFYSASLNVNGASWLLRTACTAAPTLVVTSNGPSNVVALGSPVDFGLVMKRRSIARTFTLRNTTDLTLAIGTVTVAGESFRTAAPLDLPAQLAPGASLDFEVCFEPQTSGVHAGTLKIDDRPFALQGTAFDPPLPQPALSITGAAMSHTQPKLAVRFAELPETSATGTLCLDFRPDVPNAADDPAVYFVSNGSRKLSVKVVEGDAAALFGTVREVAFQTGTTAGTLTFTLEIAQHVLRETLEILPAAITVESATATRRASTIDVSLSGFDNTRSAGRFVFRFYDRSGALIQPGAIPVDSTADFSRYFAISRVGGSFLTRLSFPVSGDATGIAEVEVDVLNAAGAVKTSRLQVK